MEQETQVIEALRKADKGTIAGNAIHHSLDKGESVITILSTVASQMNDDKLNHCKIMQKALGEGYEYLNTFCKNYKLI